MIELPISLPGPGEGSGEPGGASSDSLARDKHRSANESGFGDSIPSTYDSNWSVSTLQRSDLMPYAVRMVTPMRREFGRSMDVTHFLYDTTYAREIIAQAKTSRDARLRGYATFLEIRLLGEPTIDPAVVTGINATPASIAGLPAAPRLPGDKPRPDNFLAAKAFAAESLSQLLGPSSGKLCRKIAASTDMASFVDVFDRAYSVVRDIHGADEARRFGAAIEAKLGGDVSIGLK